MADALLDPAMSELVWADSGAARPRALPADGVFCRRLGERLGRGWLGPLAATDHGGPLIAWMGTSPAFAAAPAGRPAGYDNDPWRQRQEHQTATTAGQLRWLCCPTAPSSPAVSASRCAGRRSVEGPECGGGLYLAWAFECGEGVVGGAQGFPGFGVAHGAQHMAQVQPGLLHPDRHLRGVEGGEGLP